MPSVCVYILYIKLTEYPVTFNICNISSSSNLNRRLHICADVHI